MVAGKITMASVHYVFFVCPHYKIKRSRLLSDLNTMFDDVNRNNFILKVFKNLSYDRIVSICSFWIDAMRVRNFMSTF